LPGQVTAAGTDARLAWDGNYPGTPPSPLRLLLLLRLFRLHAILIVEDFFKEWGQADMTTISSKPMEPVTPTDEEVGLAREAGQQLAKLAALESPVEVKVVGKGAKGESLVLPASSLKLLADILQQMASGHGVAVLSVDAELSTQQAAEVLNVSRPFLIKLLDERKLPHRKVGAHRRVLLRDVLDYKKKTDAERLEVLRELAEQAQELDMGY
jgi:excisionase family DNA binding protein